VFGNVPDAEMKDILKGSLYCWWDVIFFFRC
jgi:hypothetical protein